MKKSIIITIIVLSCCCINAQILTGIVYDKITKQPIPDVHVYLDGTLINDITGASGKFELKVEKILNTKLVLHHLSYQTVIIENPFERLPDKFYMEERVNMLSDVTIQADRFTREQKLKAFSTQFLGMTQAGRSCKIVNESDIRIWYNMQTQTLLASSDNPIVVINEYLGYQILFTLVDFWVSYSIVTLNNDYVRQSFFAVTTSYTDLNPNNARIKRRRDEVYEKSSASFFRNFANNTLNEAGFKIYRNGFQITDHSHYFMITDTLSLKKIRLNPNTIQSPSVPGIRIESNGTVKSSSPTISVLYRREQSDISFFTNTFLVDQYGNIDQIDKVAFSGVMGQNRAGNMLPLEYEP